MEWMESLVIVIVIGWVLLWFAVLGIAVPAAALGRAAPGMPMVSELGPALVWTWLTFAIGVPLCAAVHGFNWATALLLSVAWPTALWLIRHRGSYRATFREHVRGLVFRILATRPTRALITLVRNRSIGWAMPLLTLPLLANGIDIRLPVPADFDTFWHTRALLGGTAVWDPLAALSAVLIRLSAADALYVAAAVRAAVVSLTAVTVAVPIGRACRSWPVGAAIAFAVITLSPRAPATTWAIALVTLIAAGAVGAWCRTGSARDGWHAVAACVLVLALLLPFSHDPAVLFQTSRTPSYREHRAAAEQVVRLARMEPDEDWVVVGAPELELEREGGGRFYDLAHFVSRFRDRTRDANFRFDPIARRLFVFVEKQPFEADGLTRGVRFVAGQQAAYLVPRERSRLHSMARRMCDDYRRTHVGTAIVYDDAALRIYRIDL